MKRALLLGLVGALCQCGGGDLVFVDVSNIPLNTKLLWLTSRYHGISQVSDFTFAAPNGSFQGRTSLGLNVPPGQELVVTVEARDGDCALASQSITMPVGSGRTVFGFALAVLKPPECVAHLPIGAFSRGCAMPQDKNCDPDEGPLTSISTGAVDIDINEVSHASYQACTACTPPLVENTDVVFDHPQTGITWDQASAYCAWRGKRLLTEAEWERGARGDDAARIYPWGFTAPTCTLANHDSAGGCALAFAPVTDYPTGASPFGLLNMAGNAAEWVSDYYADSYGPEIIDPLGPATGSAHVIRGGSYLDPPQHIRASSRFSAAPDGTDVDNTVSNSDRLLRTGVRCGRTVRLPPIAF